MKHSLKLFSLGGVTIQVHWSFPLILIWAAIQFGLLCRHRLVGALFGVMVVALLFAIVILHELGHSLVARYFGVPVKHIQLLPFGGIARLSQLPPEPGRQLAIVVAGPAVNAGLALVFGFLAASLNFHIATPAEILRQLDQITFSSILGYLFYYNLLVGLVSLLPAYPMDGGRAIRALLAIRWEGGKATSVARMIGRATAALLGLYGILNGGLILILVALFIFLGAGK